MTPLDIAELTLIDISRTQREAFARWSSVLVAAGVPQDKARKDAAEVSRDKMKDAA